MADPPIYEALSIQFGVRVPERPSPWPRNERSDMTASQNGWVANERDRIDRDAVAVGTNVEFPGGVRRDAPGQLLMEVAGRFHREVEALRPGWCWGYAEREIRGGTALSNHSSGTAIDVNAPEHPMGVHGTFTAAQAAAIRRIVADTDGVVRWGGDYRGRKDEMHFEINDDVSLADCERALSRLRGASPAPPEPPSHDARVLVYREGEHMMRGGDVERLQAVLNAWYPWLHLVEDGIYGEATEAAVRELQRRAGITVDGICGPQTRRVLGL